MSEKVWTEEEFNELYEDEPEPIYCPYCIKRGYKILLGPKILMPNEPRPSDYENYLQCPTCYVEIPIYEMPKEETIKDTVETIDNPFDSCKFEVQTIKKRTAKTISKRSRKKIKLDDDPEIIRCSVFMAIELTY